MEHKFSYSFEKNLYYYLYIYRLISASHRANKKSAKVCEVESRGYQDIQGVTAGDTHAKT